MRLARGRRLRTSGWQGSWSRTASRLSGPLYAVAGGGPALQAGCGSSGQGRDLTVSVSVRHVRDGGEVEVETSDEQGWPADDWVLATDWLSRALPPGDVAFPLRLSADRWEQDVTVDGRDVRFVVVGDAQVWCATATVDGRSVQLSARGWPLDRLALVAVRPADVVPMTADRP